jgi:ATP-binding cassette subfamily A (ABC1) protein 3
MLILKFFIISDETNFAPGYGFIDVALLFFLYSLSNIGYVLIMCCFFTKAKTGSQAVTFIQLIINFLYFLRFSSDVAGSAPLVVLLSLFPQLCFNMTISKIAFISRDFVDFSFNITYEQGVVTMFGTFIVFTMIALYLDEIVPNEMGTHKHPLFFLGVGSSNQVARH